ncbi:MAG: hypothetical protein IJM96_01440 [Clostridia bacterium]|nr:hypothetical protein [Clostridia bacterium]
MVICSKADIIALVEKWGFVPFFKNEIKGFSIEELIDPSLWFGENDGPWEWKGPVIRETGCAYGKFFRGKAVFISRDWICDFANWRRDGYDHDARYDDGLASYNDRQVCEVLENHSSLLSKNLKELSGFGRNGKKGFDGIITRLQMQGYLTTSDFEYMKDKKGKVYGWGVARYATFEQQFGEFFTQNVYKCQPSESYDRIFNHICRLFPDVDEGVVRKILK